MTQQRRRQQGPKRSTMTPEQLVRAAALRRFRTDSKLTQVEIASQLGVSREDLAKMERGNLPISDEIMAHFVELARDRAGAGQGEPPANGEGAPPPGGQAPPPSGAGDTPPDVPIPPGLPPLDPQAVQQALAAMTPQQANEAAVASLAAVYELLGVLVGRFSPAAGGVIQQDKLVLSASVVAAAEVSPLVRRILELLEAGPVAGMILAHAMTGMKIDQAVRAERAAAKQAQAAASPPPPMPAQNLEHVDPTVGAFGVDVAA